MTEMGKKPSRYLVLWPVLLSSPAERVREDLGRRGSDTVPRNDPGPGWSPAGREQTPTAASEISSGVPAAKLAGSRGRAGRGRLEAGRRRPRSLSALSTLTSARLTPGGRAKGEQSRGDGDRAARPGFDVARLRRAARAPST